MRRVEDVVAVDPDGAGAKARGDLVGFVDVARPNAGRETVFGVVGLGDQVVDIAERNGGDDGPENLFSDNFHFVVGVHEHGRLDEVAFIALPAAARKRFRTLGESRFEVAADAIKLFFGNEGAHVRRRIHSWTHANLGSFGSNSFDDFVEEACST